MEGKHTRISGAEAENLRRAQRKFLMVGIMLFIFTGVTVAVATVPWLDFGAHGFDRADAVIGLLTATFKASLVALVFMHLNHEKPTIYWIFGLGLIHAAGFFIGTYMHFADLPHDRYFYGSRAGSSGGDMMTDINEAGPGPP